MSIDALANAPSLIYAPQAAPGGQGKIAGAQTTESIERFEQMLADGVREANLEQTRSSEAVTTMVETQGANLHEAMIALSRAEIALRLTTKIGSKLVTAYNDLSRMQI